MAIAYDANSTENTQGATSLTWSHVCTGDNRSLVLVVSQFDSGNPLAVTATYDSVSMTQLGTQEYGNGNDQQITLLGMAAPASGTNDIVVSVSSSSWMACAAASFTGVDQTTPFGTATAEANDNSTTASIDITSELVDWVVDGLCWFDGAHTLGAGQTQRVLFDGGSSDDSALISTEPGAATVTMSHSWSAAEYSGHVAVNNERSTRSRRHSPLLPDADRKLNWLHIDNPT